ncbi:MAG TPA: tRNA 2-selenouridine(34) synthase MnmH [Limnobacter sp.]|uniref:tRNA 2-selenouridine(34) synthase MnmH n=1 Tax=Limnobacter sp. TaxID=2003368 RepID=UPI002ED77BBF
MEPTTPAQRSPKHPDLVDLGQLDDYTVIIDVRSPAEYALDHIPGAISCPVLDDEERIRVGTLYKQVSPFEAKKVGAALVSKNIARHLEEQFIHHDKQWKPLIYCWRGGSRSGAMTTVLRQVGWPAAQLKGGYKVFRTQVLSDLAQWPAKFQYRVVCGETGSAKTRLLEEIARQGGQVLDLETLACHKGSVLGVLPGQSQPSQKLFETRVWNVLRTLNPEKPVYIEAESKKIGSLRVPEALIECMREQGTVLRMEAPVSARVEYLLRDYDYFLSQPELLKTQLGFLYSLHGQAVLAKWNAWVDAAAWPELVTDLLVNHYDPAYRKSTSHNLKGYDQATVFAADALDDTALRTLAAQVLAKG